MLDRDSVVGNENIEPPTVETSSSLSPAPDPNDGALVKAKPGWPGQRPLALDLEEETRSSLG